MLGRLKVGDKDVAKITQWIEDDAITQDMYTERLDEILSIGTEADKSSLASTNLSSAGSELMEIWNQLDTGRLKQSEAFDEADKVVRQRNAAKEL